MTRYGFKLCIVEQSAHSETAQANLKRICESLTGSQCDITVLDASNDPSQAEVDQILATPTLIKEYPLPSAACSATF
jgi:circadian clock protein KaiB